jgi:hypothetical protein
MRSYDINNEGLEVILLALQILEKQGYKYPSIVKESHYAIAQRMTRELLLLASELNAEEDEDGGDSGD